MASEVRRAQRTVGLLLLLLGLASPAFANVGTLLIWATIGHLLVGNAIIGAIEAWIAGRLVRGLSGPRTTLLLIAANYASLLIGLKAIPLIRSALAPIVLGDRPVYHLPWLILAILLIAFVLTVLVEWPFFALAAALNRKLTPPLAPRRIFGVLLVANLASYLLLACYYAPSARVSLLTQCTRLPRPDFSKTHDAVIYYRPSRESDDLYRLRLDGSAPVHLPGSWQARKAELGAEYRHVGNDMNARAVDLRKERAPKWTDIWAGFWANEGLSAGNARTGQKLRLALEMPYFMWTTRNATVLPGNQVIYQTDRCIVLLDLDTRRLADLAMGDAPLVVLEEPESPG